MKKYKVTKEFMDNLVGWRDKQCIDVTRGYGFVYHDDLAKVPSVVRAWWLYDNASIERNRRLVAIVSWLNGEEVFDVEEPHKYVVRTSTPDSGGDYWYVSISHGWLSTVCAVSRATRFNTYREAKEWASSRQVVVEVDENGKEV